jgi:predicted RNA-binding Zn-ribbon protein involved in translation (DUF1610 family)
VMDPTERCPYRDEHGQCALPNGHQDYVYHLTDAPALSLLQSQAFMTAVRGAREKGRVEVRRAFSGPHLELEPSPIPMRLVCEGCGKLHIDEGEFATKLHHTHSCQHCGLTWRPAVVPTVGVRFLPGFLNNLPGAPCAVDACPKCGHTSPGHFWRCPE